MKFSGKKNITFLFPKALKYFKKKIQVGQNGFQKKIYFLHRLAIFCSNPKRIIIFKGKYSDPVGICIFVYPIRIFSSPLEYYY